MVPAPAGATLGRGVGVGVAVGLGVAVGVGVAVGAGGGGTTVICMVEVIRGYPRHGKAVLQNDTLQAIPQTVEAKSCGRSR